MAAYENTGSVHVSRALAGFDPPEVAKFRQLQAACEYFDASEEALIQILHRAQELFGYLRGDVIRFIAKELNLPLSRVYGVITFYSFFSTVPKGQYTVMVCMGTACYVRGADKVLEAFEKELGIKVGQTTPDGKFSLTTARCIGACGLAPVAVIGEDVHSRLKADQVKKVLQAYR
jgi:NADP-reducing hydrogenase subunit HndA